MRAEDATAILRWRTGVVGQQFPRRLPLQTEAPAGVTLPDESDDAAPSSATVEASA